MTYLGIQLVEDILEVVTLDRFFGIEEFEELLHELRRHIDLQAAHFNALIDDQLQEKFVNALQMWPGRVHILLGLDTRFREAEASFFNIGKRTEDVLLNHLDDLIKIGDYQAHNVFLVLQELLQLIDGLKAVSLRRKEKTIVKNLFKVTASTLTLPFTSLVSSL